MAVIEQSGLMKYKDTDGNVYLLYPVTTKENVDGIEEFDAHLVDKNNPHGVTAEQIGLGNVDNTADADKSVKSATSADSATKATQDASGNVIASTYETKTDASNKLTEAKNYADSAATKVKNDLLNGAGTAYDTLKELGDLIDDNQDAIGALETVAAGKADAEHEHEVGDITGLGSLATKSTVAKTDLESSVQTSLNKADTALQSFTETDPTVPAWAKAANKPTYTASEVGAAEEEHEHSTSDISGLGSLATKSSVAKSDLESSVQTSLGKADTALQSYTETDPTVPAWAKAATKPSYTASEVGADPSGSADAALASAKTYVDNAAATVKNDLLNGAGTAYDTLKELGDLIDENVDAIEALETVAAGKANATDLADHVADTSNPHNTKWEHLGESPTGGDTLTWDGNTEGLTVDSAGMFYKVSDLTLTESELLNGYTTTLSDGTEYVYTTGGTYDVTAYTIVHDSYILNANGQFIVVYEATTITETGATVNEPGVYFACMNGGYLPSLTIPGYTGFPSVNKVPEKYLPEHEHTVAEDLATAYDLPAGATTEDVLQQIINLNVSATEETLPVALKYRSLAYGSGKFVAVAYDSDSIVYSEDGVTWTTATLPVSKSWYSVVYGGGAFVAVAYSTTSAVRSTDGVNWEEITLPKSASWCSITYGNGRFVAISGHASTYKYVAVSSDGVTWESATLPSDSKWRVVTYGAGKFVAISGSGAVAAISSDGKTWEEITLPVSGTWVSAAYGNGMFIAVDTNSATAIRSTDGRTWTTITMPGSYSWAAIAYGDGKFVAAGYTSKIYYSTDGLTWAVAATLDSSRDIEAVTYGAGKFVAIEDQETAVHCITIANALGLDRFAEKSELDERISGVYSAIVDSDAANKKYVDDAIAALTAESWTFTLEDGSTVTKAVYVG